MALGILLRGAIVLIWSAQQQYPAQRLDITNFAIALPGGARISLCAALLVATTALVYGSLLAFLRFGRWGVRMRAAGQSPLLAAQRGINLHAVYALAWGLSTLTGALAGMLIALELAASTRPWPSSASRRFRPRWWAGWTASSARCWAH